MYPLPLPLYLALMIPSSPGNNGFSGFSGMVQPQEAVTPSIINGLVPVFLKRHLISISFPAVSFPSDWSVVSS